MNEEQIDFTKLGAIEREQTVSDFDLGAFTPSVQIPATFLPLYNIVIENQGRTPSCGAHAGAELKDIFTVIKNQSENRVSPKYLWKKIKLIDGFAPEDGTSLPCILGTLSKSGACKFDLMPNDTNVSVAEYTNPTTITPEMDVDALNHRTGPYAFTFSPTVEQLKQAIFTHKAVILLIRIGKEFWTDKNGNFSYAEKDLLPLRSTEPITSGHFITAFGYDENFIYFYNHWDKTWGKSGVGYFGADYMSRIVEMGTAVDFGIFEFTQTLRFGMSGTDVGMLQKTLKTEGFFPANISITSYFGPITQKAVKDFQVKNGLVVDGVVGSNTNKALNNLIK